MCCDEEVQGTLSRALSERADSDSQLIENIRPIIWANFQSGRIGRIKKVSRDFDPAGYIDRVGCTYQEWHNYVHLLHTGHEPIWLPLYVRLQKWAYRLLERRGFSANRPDIIFDRAVGCANEAAILLLEKRFTYDVHFQKWAYRVLQNAVWQHIDGVNKADKIGNGEHLIYYEDWPGWSDNLEDHAISSPEQRITLLDAIERMSTEDRRQLITCRYLEGMSLAECASLMNRSMNAIYKLHYDARKDLLETWHGKNE